MLGAERGMSEEPEPADSVVERDEHDPASHQWRVGDRHLVARTDKEGAAVDPHHYRALRLLRRGRSDDVDREAVLALRRLRIRGLALQAGVGANCAQQPSPADTRPRKTPAA